jgi:hypothetical protein
MSLLPGLTEFNNHGIEVFNNDLYRVHRCFQDAVTRPVKNEDERKALIKAAFQFEERGLVSQSSSILLIYLMFLL